MNESVSDRPWVYWLDVVFTIPFWVYLVSLGLGYFSFAISRDPDPKGILAVPTYILVYSYYLSPYIGAFSIAPLISYFVSYSEQSLILKILNGAYILFYGLVLIWTAYW